MDVNGTAGLRVVTQVYAGYNIIIWGEDLLRERESSRGYNNIVIAGVDMNLHGTARLWVVTSSGGEAQCFFFPFFAVAKVPYFTAIYRKAY